MGDINPTLLMSLGALSGLVLIGLVIILTLRLKKTQQVAEHKPVVYEKSTSAQTSASFPSVSAEDDRNPDVVPHTTGRFSSNCLRQ